MVLSNQASDHVHKSANWTTMSKIFNLENVLESIDHAFNNGTFAKKKFIN